MTAFRKPLSDGYSIFFAGDPASAIRTSVTTTFSPPFYLPYSGGLPKVIAATDYVDATFFSYTLSGFIERPGNPAPQCEYSLGNSVADGGVPGVTTTVISNSSDPCLAIPGNNGTGNTGYYEQVVYGNLDYTITASKTNGNSCGVTDFDAGKVADQVLYGSFTEIQEYYAADVDLNNQVGTHDVVLINSIINGTFSPPSGYSSWKFIPTDNYTSLPNPPVDNSNFLLVTPGDITVQNVQSNQSNQDFIAIKRGDINQSCTSCYQTNFGSGDESDARSTLPSIHLFIEDRALHTGESILIPLQTHGFKSLFSSSFALVFDPEYLQVEQVTAGDLPLDWGNIAWNDEEGLIKYAWTSSVRGGRGLSDGDYILWVRATVLREAASLMALLKLASKPVWQNEFFDASLQAQGKFEWSDFSSSHALKEGLQLSGQPNPFQHDITLRFNLTSPGLVLLQIVDFSGREMARFENHLDIGIHQWHPESVAGWPAGIYLCRLETGLASHVIKIIKY